MPYNTVTKADEYFSARYGFAKWEPLTNPEKTAVLVSASQILDSLYDWYGSKLVEDQTSEFPRDYQITVPIAVEYAELEIAYQIVDSGSLSMIPENPLEELKAGSVSLKFNIQQRAVNPLLNGLIRSYLDQFGELKTSVAGNTSRMIPVSRG